MGADRRAVVGKVVRQLAGFAAAWWALLTGLYALYRLAFSDISIPDPIPEGATHPRYGGRIHEGYIDWLVGYSTFDFGISPERTAPVWDTVSHGLWMIAIIVIATAMVTTFLLVAWLILRRCVASSRLKTTGIALAIFLSVIPPFILAYPVPNIAFVTGLFADHLISRSIGVNVGHLAVLATAIALPLVGYVVQRVHRAGALAVDKENSPMYRSLPRTLDLHYVGIYAVGSILAIDMVYSSFYGLGTFIFDALSQRPVDVALLFGSLVGLLGALLLVRTLWNVGWILIEANSSDTVVNEGAGGSGRGQAGMGVRPVRETIAAVGQSRGVRIGVVVLLAASILGTVASQLGSWPLRMESWEFFDLVSVHPFLLATGTLAIAAVVAGLSAILVGVSGALLVTSRNGRIASFSAPVFGFVAVLLSLVPLFIVPLVLGLGAQFRFVSGLFSIALVIGIALSGHVYRLARNEAMALAPDGRGATAWALETVVGTASRMDLHLLGAAVAVGALNFIGLPHGSHTVPGYADLGIVNYSYPDGLIGAMVLAVGATAVVGIAIVLFTNGLAAAAGAGRN